MTTPVLPDGGILLHVAPGGLRTTAIQGAPAAAGRRLTSEGIRVPAAHKAHAVTPAGAIERAPERFKSGVGPPIRT